MANSVSAAAGAGRRASSQMAVEHAAGEPAFLGPGGAGAMPPGPGGGRLA